MWKKFNRKIKSILKTKNFSCYDEFYKQIDPFKKLACKSNLLSCKEKGKYKPWK